MFQPSRSESSPARPHTYITWTLLLLGTWGCTLKRPAQEASPSEEVPAPASDAAHLPTIENGPWMDTSLTSDERVSLLLQEMTTDEKLTLLFGYYGADASWRGYTAPAEARPGSAGYVPGNARLGIPPQWQTDAGMGVATQGSAKTKLERTALPSGLCTAATFNPELAEQAGAMIGAEARASGFNVMLAGSVNLVRDPYNGRNFEYGGEDPFLAGTMVGAQIAGVQSRHVISTMKHFAINDQETDRDKGNSIIDDASARTSDLLAFEFAHERGAPGAVMCAYNQVNGVFSCENDYLLNQVLRRDWGFRGYVMSDWGAVHSTVKAARAGLEQMSGFPFDEQPYFGKPLKKAVKTGEVSQKRLDEMAARVLWPMFEHGLFEHPVPSGTLDANAHGKVSQLGAEEGAVLLKNAGALLPLSSEVKKIAVIGGHADRGVLSGGGSSQVYPRGENAVPGIAPTSWPGPVVYYPSSPLLELKKEFPKSQVDFAPKTDLDAAAALAKQSDVAIVFLTQWTTESIDTTIELPEDQDKLVQRVAAANPNTVVVLETGGPVLMPWETSVRSILQAWYPGTEGGRAIARLLSGEANPSGHLPVTLFKDKGQLPRPEPPHAGDVHFKEGATVGYKWFDANNEVPLFEFGHGLSYTTFELSKLAAESTPHGIEVSFSMTNTGPVAGKAVGQVYVARAGLEAPQRLGGFQKLLLKPNQTRSANLRIDPRLLATWDTQSRSWIIAEGPVEIRLATSSRHVSERVMLNVKAQKIPARGPQH